MTCELYVSLEKCGAGSSAEGSVLVRCGDVADAHIDVVAKVHSGSLDFRPDCQTTRQRVFTGPLVAGERRVPICITVPSYPPSYEGIHIAWEWRVEAELIQGGNVLARGHAVLPPSVPPRMTWRLVPDQQGRADAVDVPENRSSTTLILVTGLLALGSLGLMVLGIYESVAHDSEGFLVGLGTLLTVVFGFAYLNLRAGARVRRMVGAPQLVIDHDVDAGTLRCTLWTRPPGPPNEVRARLDIREETIEPHPTRDGGKLRIRHPLWEASTTLTRAHDGGPHIGTLPARPPEPLPPFVFDKLTAVMMMAAT